MTQAHPEEFARVPLEATHEIWNINVHRVKVELLKIAMTLRQKESLLTYYAGV